MFQESKTFSHIEGSYIALCELSIYQSHKLEGVWYYFNRLSVPPKLRKKGIAKKLLGEMCEWADDKEINIWLDINPYGDLDLRQLISLYSKFGFKQTLQQGTMIRRYNEIL